jgi:hypothetical protein
MQTCKIILATSLIWFLVDVVVLIYYTDCRGPGCEGRNDSKGPSADPLVHSDDNPIGGGNHIDDRGGGDEEDDGGEFGVSEILTSINYIAITYFFPFFIRINYNIPRASCIYGRKLLL